MSKAVNLSNQAQFALPPSLVGRPDVSRLLLEIEKVDNELETQAIREPNKPLAIPNMSRSLTEATTLNQLDITNRTHRQAMLKAMRVIKDKSPIVQVTFAVDPAPEIVLQLTTWIRQNLHPAALITVGMQPGIIGGCVLRTPDHIYDFSLRKQFTDNLPVLIEQIKAASQVPPAAAQPVAGAA